MEKKKSPPKRMARKKKRNGNGLESLVKAAADFVSAGLRLKKHINQVKHQRKRKRKIMAKQKAGAKKLRRSGKDKAYYAAFRAAYPGKLIRRRAKREKRIAAALSNPSVGSPSQLRTRREKGILPKLSRKLLERKGNEVHPPRVESVRPQEVPPG